MKTEPLYLNGRWVTTKQTLNVTNPATGEVFAQASLIGRSEVNQALKDASKAFPAWRNLSAKDRGIYLHRIADAVEARAEEFARTITLENGKSLSQSRGEVAMTIDHLHWFGEEARRAYGRVVPHQVDGKRHLVLKQPIGVVGAIAPWNFPLVLGIRKVGAALAAGCPVILKPASATPVSSIRFSEAVDSVGLPPGLFQLVLGDATEIAAEFFENSTCRKISFTGSTEVGQSLIRNAAQGMKKLSLELGGNAPVIVFEDADLDSALEGVLITKFRNTGQSCIAANRVYIHSSIYKQFTKKLAEKTSQLKIGDGLEQDVEIGPLIDQSAVEQGIATIQQAVSAGAQVLCGGKPVDLPGAFLQPTLLVDVPEDARCMHSETFAPIVPLIPFETETEVIEKANNTEYGLAAYLFTQNLARGWRVAEALEAGTIGLNDAVPATSQCPFGGMKMSGQERELGTEGMEAYLETKHVSISGIYH